MYHSLSRIKWIWIAQIGLLIIALSLAVALSFQVPTDEDNSLDWIIKNKLPMFITYCISGSLVILLFFVISFSSWETIEYAHPMSFPGIFIYFAAVLLISSFFIPVRIHENPSKTLFYNTHPLIFYSEIVLLILGILASIIETVKIEHTPHPEQGHPPHTH